jgi:vacuolar-type H+-ATPase subunit I/STV1
MSEARQTEIENAFHGAVHRTDVCASVQNMSNLLSEYGNEADEEYVVHSVFSAVFNKYKSLRSTSKDLRDKLKEEKASHAASVKSLEDKIRVLEKSLGDMRMRHSKQVATMKSKIGKYEEEEKARQIKASAVYDENGGPWYSVRRPTATSTQKKPKSKKCTKNNKRSTPSVVNVSETSDDDEDEVEQVTPPKLYYRDTCAMISPIKKY